MGLSRKTLGYLYSETRSSIFKFCGAFNFEPTEQQRAALQEVEEETRIPVNQRLKRLAIKSGQGTGKSTVSGLIGLWRAWQVVDGLTVVTAPTMRQVKDVWLAEVSRRVQKAQPWVRELINVTSSRVSIAGRKKWGVWTITATKPENAQGYHQDNLTFILDEASGVPRPIWETIKGTLTNEDSLLVAIGNPNVRDCAFFDCFHSQRHLWRTHTFSSENSPLADKGNLRRIEDEFGRDSDVYRVRVLGEFPFEDPNCVMAAEDLEACQQVSLYDAAFSGKPLKQIGIDLARYGSDESTIYMRQGNAIIKWKFFCKTDPNTVIDAAFAMQKEQNWKNSECVYVADADGIGQGCMRRFYDANKTVIEFQSNRSSSDPDYANLATQAWFQLGRRVKARELHLPRDNRLVHQLSSRRYKTDSSGRLILEKKDDYKKRNEEESPDRADGMVMAFFDSDQWAAKLSFRADS